MESIFSKYIKNKGGQLFIKEFPTGTASVNTLRAHLQSLQRDHGIKPDVLFVDYADIMKSTSEYSERRYNLTSIYETLRAMAMELDIPIWTATQANREAINSPKFDLRVISESLGKAQTADLILGIGRTEEDKAVIQIQPTTASTSGPSLDIAPPASQGSSGD